MFDLRVGRTNRCGKKFLRNCVKTPISKKYFWTAPWCVPISMQQALPKKGAQALGRSRGGLTTKIHACVEGLGQLVCCILTGGQVHDVTQAPMLLAEIEPEAVLADKAYDADALLHCIESKGAKAVIPPKANRKVRRSFDRQQYRNRNVIERFFAQLKQFRRVATRYDKLISRFESFVIIAASVLWMK